MNAMPRTPASPYARRLARERGVALSAIAGSGPNGRIVGADVPPVSVAEAVKVDRPETALPVAAPMVVRSRSIGAFAADLNLAPLQAFNAALETALPLECFLIKAAARACGSRATGVCWQSAEGARLTLAGPADLSPSSIARSIAAGKSHGDHAPLLLSRIVGQAIRPVASPLSEGFDLRLLVVASDDAPEAHILLVHDADLIGENEACRLVTAFRHLCETPLQLLV
jgi:e3 binding domain